VGCGRIAPKTGLQRLAVSGDRVVSDAAAIRPGRGAYVCDARCAEAAMRRRALPRAFRRAVVIPTDLLESIG
jgi:predicted RNA-binding protein YlxR (DUF448 family)